MTIRPLLTQGESQELEYKASFDKATIETLIAYANAQGGRVLVGVTDKRQAGLNQSIGCALHTIDCAKHSQTIRQNALCLLALRKQPRKPAPSKPLQAIYLYRQAGRGSSGSVELCRCDFSRTPHLVVGRLGVKPNLRNQRVAAKLYSEPGTQNSALREAPLKLKIETP